MSAKPSSSGRRGSAYVLALLFIALFVTVGVSLAALTNASVRAGKNTADIHRARLVAESGLAFALHHLRAVALPHDTDADNVVANLASALGGRLHGTENLAGAPVTHTASAVVVPPVQTLDGQFRIRIRRADTGEMLTLEVCGEYAGVRRVLAADLKLRQGHPNSVFDYGLASRGPISISGNGEIRGRNTLTEASVISTTDEAVAVSIGGNAVVDGDISSTGTDTSVVVSGTPTIAGSQDPDVMAEHMHLGVEPPAFPEVDTRIFRPLAVNVVDAATDTGQRGAVFENILIKAGTNPTFASDVVINGIVYIEAPNVVNFSGKVTLNGLVATDASDYGVESCKLSFQGQVDAFGVEALPDLPRFEAVKRMTGTFICAPGFDVNFAGRFTTINGTVAADRLTFSGQAEGTIRGSVIGLSSHPTSVSGQVNIIIDRSGEDRPAPGFLMPKSLELVPGSYREPPTSEFEP